MPNPILKKKIMILFLLLAACRIFANITDSPERADDFHHCRPAGYEEALVSLGNWDYYGLIHEAIEAGTKYIVACSVAKAAVFEGVFGVSTLTTKYNENKEQFTASPAFMVFENFTGIRKGCIVVMYCQFKYLYIGDSHTIPVFHVDGWQFWYEYQKQT